MFWLTLSLIQLETSVSSTLSWMKQESPRIMEVVHSIYEDINKEETTPLSHMLHLAGSHSNVLSTHRCHCLVKGPEDPQVGQWLENSAESLLEIFPADAFWGTRRLSVICYLCYLWLPAQSHSNGVLLLHPILPPSPAVKE